MTYATSQYIVLAGDNHYGRWGKGSQGIWQIYKDIVIKTGVPVEKAAWYIRWVEKFAKSIKGKPLRGRDRQEVDAFLADLEAKGRQGKKIAGNRGRQII